MTNRQETRHNQERDRLLAGWASEPGFECAGCGEAKLLPSGFRIEREVQGNGFRADLAAMDKATGNIVGTVEIIDKGEPSEQTLLAQEKLEFAYYQYLPRPVPRGKRRSLDYFLDAEWKADRGGSPSKARGDLSSGAWLCSVECLRWWQQWGGYPRSEPWDALKCDDCGIYLHENAISDRPFQSWAYDPHTTFCIHCAAQFTAVAPDVQWRSPGELAGGDPREWTPREDKDPADLLLAYTEAAFWDMVWKQRVAELDNPDTYAGRNHQQAEEATERRLLEVTKAFDGGEWRKGANLLLPVGAPGWQAFEDEPERLLAFRDDNCSGTAKCWSRLLQHRSEELPEALRAIIRAGEPQRQLREEEQLREKQRADHMIEQQQQSREEEQLREKQRADHMIEQQQQSREEEQLREKQRTDRMIEQRQQSRERLEDFQEWFDQRRTNG